MSLRVGVFGAGGRMGSTVCRAVDDDPALTLVAAVDPHHVGLDMRQVTGVDEPFLVAADGQAFLDADAQVVVDFTDVDAARENLLFLAENGIHAVTGTTGFSDDDYAAFTAAFTRSNCVIAPNFAIGAVLMMRFAQEAAQHMQKAEIIELHHDGKLDAPSGTAARTAELMARASGHDPPPIHSVRLPGLVANQEVILGDLGQTLSIRHDTISRESFMPGVLLAVRRVGSLSEPVVVGLESLLF